MIESSSRRGYTYQRNWVMERVSGQSTAEEEPRRTRL